MNLVRESESNTNTYTKHDAEEQDHFSLRGLHFMSPPHTLHLAF